MGPRLRRIGFVFGTFAEKVPGSRAPRNRAVSIIRKTHRPSNVLPAALGPARRLAKHRRDPRQSEWLEIETFAHKSGSAVIGARPRTVAWMAGGRVPARAVTASSREGPFRPEAVEPG